jgi:hypothetical protein
LKLRKNATLAEVAARASEQLDRSGIPVAVVGGSAITLHAPEIYTSKDIDFAAIRGTNRRAFAAAVAPIGFTARGRDFVHKDTEYTLDLVADTPYIDQRPITRFAMADTPYGPVRVYRFEDAIADRIAAFLHWGDSQSLEVAERAVEALRKDVRWPSLEKALRQLDASLPEGARRLEMAVSRLRARHSMAIRRGK